MILRNAGFMYIKNGWISFSVLKLHAEMIKNGTDTLLTTEMINKCIEIKPVSYTHLYLGLPKKEEEKKGRYRMGEPQ